MQIKSITFTRCVAIVGIIFSHYFMVESLPYSSILQRLLGETFNGVFFYLSALLFGHKWARDEKRSFDARAFLKRRIIKLAIPLYIFLIVYCSVAFCAGLTYSWVSVVLNFLFLGWFSKIDNIGHLWFITMIMISYFQFIVMSKCQLNIGVVKGVLILSFAFLLQFLLDSMHLPGYMFIIMAMNAVIFYNADRILKMSFKIPWAVIILVCVMSYSICVYFLSIGGFEKYRTIVIFLLFVVSAFPQLVIY